MLQPSFVGYSNSGAPLVRLGQGIYRDEGDLIEVEDEELEQEFTGEIKYFDPVDGISCAEYE